MSSLENAKQFVQKLASDDAFRADTERDPVAAAAAYGFTLDPAKLPAEGIKLPPKHILQSQADALAERFADASDVVIHFIV